MGQHQTRGNSRSFLRRATCTCIFYYLERIIIGFALYFTSQDWQEGGKSEVYLWGNGRYGQLTESGINLMMPTLAPSLLQTQQVAAFSLGIATNFCRHNFCSSLLPSTTFSSCFLSGRVWAELFLPGPI